MLRQRLKLLAELFQGLHIGSSRIAGGSGYNRCGGKDAVFVQHLIEPGLDGLDCLKQRHAGGGERIIRLGGGVYRLERKLGKRR